MSLRAASANRRFGGVLNKTANEPPRHKTASSVCGKPLCGLCLTFYFQPNLIRRLTPHVFGLSWDPEKAVLEVGKYEDAVILLSKTVLRSAVFSSDLTTFLQRGNTIMLPG
jgi:hypothetical protein